MPHKLQNSRIPYLQKMTNNGLFQVVISAVYTTARTFSDISRYLAPTQRSAHISHYGTHKIIRTCNITQQATSCARPHKANLFLSAKNVSLSVKNNKDRTRQ